MSEAKLSISIKTISPDQARTLIDGHENYRNTADGRVRLYADAMMRGVWSLSVIIIDENGQLCDGKHRLEALIKANVSVTFAVISGWPVKDIICIDNGMPRSTAQIATAERGAKNANTITALIKSIDNPNNKQRALNCDSLALFDKYNKLAYDVFEEAKQPFDCAVHMAAFARAIIAYPNRRQDILTSLKLLSEMDFSDPRMAGLKLYFQWAITRGFAKLGGGGRYEVYLRCARAIVSYLNNEPLDKLYCPQMDPFDTSIPSGKMDRGLKVV